MNQPLNKTPKPETLNHPFVLSAIGVAGLVAIGFVVSWLSSSVSDPADGRGLPTPRDRNVTLGGVQRPATDATPVLGAREVADQIKRLAKVGVSHTDTLSAGEANGLVVLDRSTNVNVRNTLIAAEDRTFPERLSPTVMPARFDADTYRSNPQAYLDVVEPGRIWQSAQPEMGVQPIAKVSKARHQIKQKESVRLSVKVEPQAPVTFTSFDLGIFQNSLPSITVAANAQGIAEVAFTGTVGTEHDVNILAASPMNSGQAKFLVNITPPITVTPDTVPAFATQPNP